jgi:hypothetical protein
VWYRALFTNNINWFKKNNDGTSFLLIFSIKNKRSTLIFVKIKRVDRRETILSCLYIYSDDVVSIPHQNPQEITLFSSSKHKNNEKVRFSSSH